MARVHGAEMKRRSSHELSGLDAWIGFDSRHWWIGSPRRRPQSRNVAAVAV